MTPPMTPREKVAREIATMRMKVDQKNAEVTGHDICLVIDPYLEEAKKDIDAMLTALASGSGDHSGGVTDMVDHAELARLADDPAMDFGGFGRSRVSALLAENAALRERLETARIARAAHNRQHGEAERKLAEAVGLLRDVVSPGWTRDAWSKARSFLSKEAERG